MATADRDSTPDEPTPDKEATSTAAPEASADDELRRRYLEALERKRAGGSAAATGHGADEKGAAPTNNSKVKRTFRRRAGG